MNVRALAEAHDLIQPPYEGACCGEGSHRLAGHRYADLDGDGRDELILGIDEYVGEGCLEKHHHVFDVVGEPRSIGTISEGGYVHGPISSVVRVSTQGQALMVLGDSPAEDRADLGLWVRRGDDLVDLNHPGSDGQRLDEPNDDENDPGLVPSKRKFSALGYIPHDIDGDGVDELVLMRPPLPLEGAPARSESAQAAPASVDVLRLSPSDLELWPLPVEDYLPEVASRLLQDPSLERAELIYPMLTSILLDRGLAVSEPRQTLDALIARLPDKEDSSLPVALKAVDWAPTEDQSERLRELLDHEYAGCHAALLLLRVDPPRVERWLRERLDKLARGKSESFPGKVVVRRLDRTAQSDLCAYVGGLLMRDELDPQGRGELAWATLGEPLHCVDQAKRVIAQVDPPAHALRGAIAALERGIEDEAVSERWLAAGLGSRGLIRHIDHPEPSVRADVARTLRAYPGHRERLFTALQSEEDDNVLWALLVALQEIGGAYPSAPIVARLDVAKPRVREALHRLIGRGNDPEQLALGLAAVKTSTEYNAYTWTPIYRPTMQGLPAKALLARDGLARLRSRDPRVRQSACELFAVLPTFNGDGDTRTRALQALLAEESVDYVSEACTKALAPQRATP